MSINSLNIIMNTEVHDSNSESPSNDENIDSYSITGKDNFDNLIFNTSDSESLAVALHDMNTFDNWNINRSNSSPLTVTSPDVNTSIINTLSINGSNKHDLDINSNNRLKSVDRNLNINGSRKYVPRIYKVKVQY